MSGVTTATLEPRGRFAEKSSTLASKGAPSFFFTAYLLAAGGVKFLQLGAVGEGGDVAWRSSRTGIVAERNGCQGRR